MYVCMHHVFMHICMYVCMYECMCVCMYNYNYVCMYEYIHNTDTCRYIHVVDTDITVWYLF